MTSDIEILSSFGFIIFPISSYRTRSLPCKSMIRKMLSNSCKYHHTDTKELLTLIVFIELYWFVIKDVPHNLIRIAKRMFTAGQEVEKDAAGRESVALDCSVRIFSDIVVHKLQNFGRHPLFSSFQSTLLKFPTRTCFLDKSEIGQFHLDGGRH